MPKPKGEAGSSLQPGDQRQDRALDIFLGQRADMLVADAAALIDDEGFRHAIDAPVDADAGKKPDRQQREDRGRDQEEPVPLGHSAAAWTRAAAAARRRRAGAPTRWRRSVSEMSPPRAIAAAPSQIHGTSGL